MSLLSSAEPADCHTAAVKQFAFNDVDDFRAAIKQYRMHLTPIARKIAVRHTIINIPGIDIVLGRSFPRLMDLEVTPDCTNVSFSMDDQPQIRVNGRDLEGANIVICHGGGACSTREVGSAEIATIVFTPEVRGRGWPDTASCALMIPATPLAMQKLRTILPEIFNFAAQSPEALELPATAQGIRESLLAAVDEVFAGRDLTKLLKPPPHFAVVQRIESYLSSNIENPVYSDELAAAVNVSIRTLQDIVQRYRGMSLHSYLRLKRLWLVRKQLREGRVSVKACALAHGFWHLSDFSKTYRAQFGELPSETLAHIRSMN